MRKVNSGLIAIVVAAIAIMTCSKNKSTNSGGIPAAPNSLIGEVMSSSAVRLSWISNSSNESGFAIYRSQFGVFDHADTTGAGLVTFTATNLEDNTAYTFHIVAFNGSGASAPSNDLQLTTQHSAAAPTIPGMPIPANNATGQSINARLNWQASDPANDPLSYDLYIGAQNPPPFAAHQDSNAYTPTSSYYGGTTYFWRVVAIDTSQLRAGSPIWRFTTGGTANQPPNTPSSPNPADSATGVTVSTQLSWQGGDPDGDSLTYDIYFGPANPPPFIRNQNATSYTPQAALAFDTIYYWKIIAHDSQAQTSGPLWSFTTAAQGNQPPSTPSNPSPSNGQQNVPLATSLTWQDSDPEGDSLNFDVYFGITNPPPLIQNQRSMTYTPPSLTGSTAYYWQIVAHDNHGNQTTGPIWAFSTMTQNLPPNAPANPVPSDGQYGVSHTIILSWQASDPNGDSLNYDISFGTANPPPFVRNQTANSYDPPGALGDSLTYYWKIVVHDNHGAQTAGPVWSFTTSPAANQPPNVPSNPSPSNGAVNVPLNTVLSWQDTDPNGDPLNYDIYFGTANPPPFIRNQTGATYDPPGNLTLGTVYNWQIVAHDNHHNQTPSPIWSFTTIGNQPPAAPSNPSPPNGANDVNLNATLSWHDSDPEGDSLTYDVYLGTSVTPPLVSGGQSQTSYTPGGLTMGTIYYWKIVAHDNHGNTTTGPLWVFVTAVNLAPLPPSNPSPPDSATGVHTDASLGWNDSDPDGDPLNYDVYFGTANPPPFIRNQTSRRYNPPGNMQNSTLYHWQIVARDSHGSTTSGPLWSFTTEPHPNSPPLPPSNPSPPNGSLGISVDTVLAWQDSDPDGDTLNYDVHLGTVNPPPFVLNQAVTSYRPSGSLLNDTVYYWNIVAHDNYQNQTAGPIWHFRTIAANQPPTIPSNPAPVDNATGVDTTTTSLTWQSTDPDGDPLTYDVSFGLVNPPPFIVNQAQNSYSPGILSGGLIYYWQIAALDNHGHRTAGPIWRFTTVLANLPPFPPSNPNPSGGAVNVDTMATLSWQDADPDGDTLSYDINFGTSNPPPFVAHQAGNTYSPGVMTGRQTYYWQIVAHDNHNNQTTGPTWSFTTVGANLPPLPASNPSPPDSATGVPITATLSWQSTDLDGDTLNYDVYFGTSFPPPFLQNQPSNTFTPPGGLINGTTYFWQIYSKDRAFSVPGPIWTFTTAP